MSYVLILKKWENLGSFFFEKNAKTFGLPRPKIKPV